MGGVFSKKKKEENRDTSSAPARLEGLEQREAARSVSPEEKPAPGAEEAPAAPISPSSAVAPSSAVQSNAVPVDAGVPPTDAQSTDSVRDVSDEHVVQKSQQAEFTPAVPSAGREGSPRTPFETDSSQPTPLKGAAQPNTAPDKAKKKEESKDSGPDEYPEGVTQEQCCHLYGDNIAGGIVSKGWSDREHSLKSLRTRLMTDFDRETEEYVSLWKVTTIVLNKTIRDKVAPVYFASLEVLRTLIGTCCKHVPQSSIHDGLDEILPALIHRSGNINPRIAQASVSLLCDLSADPGCGLEYVAPFVLEPIKKTKNHTVAQLGRLELLLKLLEKCGLHSRSGLNVENVLGFALATLETPDDKVRTAAVALVTDVYSRNGGQIADTLLARLKPALRKMLQRKFAEVDELAPGGSIAYDSGEQGALPPLKGGGVGKGLESDLMLFNDNSRMNIDGSKASGGANPPRSPAISDFEPSPPASPEAPTRMTGRLKTTGPDQGYSYTGRLKTPGPRAPKTPGYGPGHESSSHTPAKKKKVGGSKNAVNQSDASNFSAAEEDLMNDILCG
ncbi:hypothetical protein CYMTET_8662 [Cymbomonas tetramitiformis]|uniref:TOG domain-containing protein n=1 Tax=Cymbomonas tetramitiformis TaxID=36881 RepID=A0AAE0LFS6_9CHLO|nr:hypothetical protein CYMTET_8662 [Cymbomonas tetramitiformis]